MTSTALRAFDRPLPEALTRLRAAMAAAGASATSPATLDADAERMAREDRQS